MLVSATEMLKKAKAGHYAVGEIKKKKNLMLNINTKIDI